MSLNDCRGSGCAHHDYHYLKTLPATHKHRVGSMEEDIWEEITPQRLVFYCARCLEQRVEPDRYQQ